MKKTRIGIIVLALCMVFALALPVTAFADDSDFTVVITDADGVPGEPIQVDAAGLVEQLKNVSGKTVSITLNKDVDAGDTPLRLPEDGTYTLDLGEYTLTSNGDTVSNYGKLTIKGSGTITSAGTSKGALVNYPGAEATAMSGKLVANTWYAVKNMGTMTLGGEVEVTTENPNASLIANGWYNNTELDRGTTYCANDAVLTITGGNFTGGMNTVKNDDRGVLTIQDGTFSNTQGAAILNWHKATINGGDFSVSDNSYIVLGNGYLPAAVGEGEDAVAVDVGELVINGGSFRAAPGGILLGYGETAEKGGSLTVTDGSFDGNFGADSYYYEINIESCEATQKVPDSMLAEGSGGLAMYGDNGAQFLVGKPADLADKVSGAQSGTTVEIYAGDVALETVPEGVSVQVGGGAATVVIDGKTYSVVTLKAATCTTAGVNRYTNVEDTADTFYRSVPASHKWDAGVVKTAATCGEDGEKVYTCTVCQLERKATIPATGEHQYDDKVKEATCTEPMQVGEVCTACGAVNGEMETVGEPLGHNYVLDKEAEGTEAATCTTDGVAVSVCSRCNDVKTETVPALGHEWDDGDLVDDCEKGQYVLYTCTRDGCGETKEELTGLVEPTEHEWVKDAEKSTEPTCTEVGKTVSTCSKCGATKTEEVPALGHDMKDTVVPPTCKDKGYTEHKCSRGDYTAENTDFVDPDPNAHVASEEGVVLKAATCTTAGVKKNVCAHCGASMGYVAIAPDHTWDAGKVTTEPTCTKDGKKTYTCQVCEETKIEVIPADHLWGEGEVTQEPTCGKDGVKKYTCTREGCDATKEEPIAATGNHNYEDEGVIPATCTEPAKVGRVCTVCYAVDGELISVGEPLGHKWNDGDLFDDCEKGQYVLYTCTRDGCGETKEELTGLVEPTEHEWVKDAEKSTEPTCTEVGKTVSTCSKCGATKTEEVPALGHDMKDTVVPPTCKDKGYTEHKCSRGDYTAENTDFVDPDPNAHVASEEGVVLKAATCTTAGVKKNVCAHCGASMGYVAIAPDHTWDDGVERTAATCTEDGEMLYTCTVCDAKKTEPIQKLNHDWDEGVVTKPATCGADGVKTFTCTREGCDATKEDPIPATGKHQYVDEVIDATCTEPAMAGRVCTGCGAVDGELTPVVGSEPLGHDWDKGVIHDNCEGQYVLRTCKTCGATKEELTGIGEVTEHDWVRDESTLTATCTEAGTVEETCSKCNATRTVKVPALGHDMVENEVPPTCQSEGYTEHKCSRCDYTEDKTDTVPADPNAHDLDYDNAYVLKEATCAEPGVIRVTCKLCGKHVYQSKTAEHTWDEMGVVTKDPTCTEDGEIEFTCTACDAKKTEPIEKLGHDWDEDQVKDDGVTIYHVCKRCQAEEILGIVGHEHEPQVVPGVEPTCTETGLTEGQKCSVCGEILVAQEVIPALGHTEEVIPGVPATCTEDGLTEGKQCSVCGEILVAQEEIPALGHTEEVLPGEPATCTETGLTEGKKCSVCGEILVAQEEIPALGHTEVEVPEVPATETEPGTTAGTKCSVCGEVLSGCEEIPPTGHVHQYVATVTAPTCTEGGYTTYTCACGDSYVADETPATGHDYKLVGTTFNSDYTKVTYEYECANCGDSYTQEFDV